MMCIMAKFIFRKERDGRIAVHDSFVDKESPTGYLWEVHDNDTGKGKGYVIVDDSTEHFYAEQEEAAEFLRSVRLRLPDSKSTL